MNKPLTSTDLAELERMLIESGIGDAEHVQQAAKESHGLGLFVRSLVGMDRGAAKEALAGFLVGKTLGANQIEFVNLVIDELSDNGVIEPRRFYESPFTDISPQGPDELFESADVDRLLEVVAAVRRRAEAA